MNITNAKRTELLSIEEYHSIELGALTASAIKQADRSMAQSWVRS